MHVYIWCVDIKRIPVTHAIKWCMCGQQTSLLLMQSKGVWTAKISCYSIAWCVDIMHMQISVTQSHAWCVDIMYIEISVTCMHGVRVQVLESLYIYTWNDLSFIENLVLTYKIM